MVQKSPNQTTWRNVADVLNDIGLHQLAEDILKVYETGSYVSVWYGIINALSNSAFILSYMYVCTRMYCKN